MRCHAPAEDAEEDDQQFLAAAQEDATLVARLLLRLSRSEASSSPWRLQLRDPASPSEGAGDDLIPLPDPPKWGQRRPRSRCLTMDGILAEKREEARRSSPTTPLSWSGGGGGGSWTSGSACESTPPPRPPKRRKQPDSSSRHNVVEPSAPSALAMGRPKPEEPREDWGHGPAPPCKRKTTEAACKGGSPRGALVDAAPTAVGSASFPGSTEVETAAVGVPPRDVAHVEPLKLRLTGEGTSSVAVRRAGKKKTVPELKALNESLLQEQVELRKDLEEQKKIFEALLEENFRLKNLESSLDFHKVGEPTVNPAAHRESESEEPQQHQDVNESIAAADRPEQVLQCTSRPIAVPHRAPLFDLNCLPDDGLL